MIRKGFHTLSKGPSLSLRDMIATTDVNDTPFPHVIVSDALPTSLCDQIILDYPKLKDIGVDPAANNGFLARMYARFLGGPAMQGSWFRCGISPGLARFTAVWSLNRPPAARAPLLGGGPARRQPLPPQGADATTLMSLRPVKVLESLGLIFLDGHCWPGASLSAKAPRNWLAAAFRPLPRPEVRAGLESLLRYETVEESLK